MTGIKIAPSGELAQWKHGVTRFRITLHCHEARFVSARKLAAGRGTEPGGADLAPMQWLAPEKLVHLPLNTTGRKLSRLLLAK